MQVVMVSRLVSGRRRRMLGKLALFGVAGAFALIHATSGWATTHLSTQTLMASATWTASASPYVLDGDVTVAAGVTLTISPGVVVKFNGSGRVLTVNGTLSAEGTSGSPIYFTSLQDDSIGGDTGGDGPTVGVPGQWTQVKFAAGSLLSAFRHVVVRYGGAGFSNSNGSLYVTGSTASVNVSDSSISDSKTSGVSVYLGSAVITRTTIAGAGKNGVHVDHGQVAVDHSTISNGQGWGAEVIVNSSPYTAASTFLDSTVTQNSLGGIFMWGGGGTPVASWPYGHRNKVYGNNPGNPDQNQLYNIGMSHTTPDDWSNNYWGPSYVSPANFGFCEQVGNTTPPPPPGPLTWFSEGFIGHILCWSSVPSLGWNDFAGIPFDGAPGVSAGETLGGLGAAGFASVGSGFSNDPVNTATGNFVHQETDLAFPSIVGVPFRFVRTYNSRDDASGSLGPGWTNSFAGSLSFATNGDATFRSPDGARFFYTKSGGTYTGDSGVTASLAAIAGGYEVTRKDQVKYSFDSGGKLVSIKDRNGQGLTLAYNGSGRLSTVTDGPGRSMSLTYNGSGRLTAVSSSDGRSVSYGFTSDGHLATVTDVRGKVWTFSYNDYPTTVSATYGLLAKETDPRGNQVFRNVYDTSARVSDQYDSFDDHTTYAYDTGTQTTTVTDPLGKVTKDIYHNNLLTQRIDPLEHTTSYAYDANMNVTSTTDARGKTTTMTYDGAGNLLTKTAPTPLSYVQTWAYNSRNDVTSYTDGRGKVTNYGYDGAGNPTTITRPGANVTTLSYDSAGKGLLVSVTDPRSKTTTFAYDSSNNLVSKTDPLGHVTTYGYDSAGRLTSVIDPPGNAAGANPDDYKTSFSYDAAGHALTRTDALGNVTTYSYDDNGNQASVKNALNKTWTFAYNAANELTSITAPDVSTTTATYTARGELASVTDQLGHKTTFGYDDAGHRSSRVTPLGNVSGGTPSDYTWAYGYDANGNLTSVTDPLGHQRSRGYDGLNRLTSLTDALSHTTTYGYDANTNVVVTTDPLSHSVTNAYDDLNRLVSSTDGRGKETDYGYDSAGNLTSTTDPLGNTTTYAYDDADRRVTGVDPRGNAAGADPNDFRTVYGYDEAGNLTSTSDPLGHTTTRGYDRDGRLQSQTDPLSHSVSYAYNETGMLSSVTAADNSTTSYGYDDVGNLTARTDANLHTTSYGYDAADQLVSLTNPLGKRWTFSYDADRELASRVDAIANAASNPSLGTTAYSYDRAGRQTGVDYSDSTPDLTYGYDAADRLTSVTDAGGAKTYGYDDANRLTTVARGTDGFSYSYDAANNLVQTTYPDATTVGYGYDDAERLGSLTNGSGTVGYGYDAAANLTSTTLPNGITDARTYDRAGQLSTVTAAAGATQLTDYQVTRNAAGYPTQISRIGGALETYSYDNVGRIASVCFQSSCPNSSDPKVEWTYDSIGRRQTETRTSGSTTYTYNAADELTSATDGATSTNYSYDADGRETAKGSSNFTYDLVGNLTSASVGATTTTYTYDDEGNRVTAADGASTTNYTWDENSLTDLPQLARESNTAGGLTRRYINDTAGPVALQTPTGNFYYLRDPQQSIAAVTDSSANTAWTYTYEPFGATKTATRVDPSAPDNPARYYAQYLDPATNLYDLHARQYDTADGRFLSRDPLAPDPATPYVNAYTYANNQPTINADPTGLKWCSLLGRTCDAIDSAFTSGRGVTQTITGLGDALTRATADQVTALLTDGSQCADHVLHGEIRGAGRQCIKTAVAVSLVVLTRGTAGAAEEGLGSGNAYSVAFETRLAKTSYPGVSRGAHFQEANANLLAAMDSDPAFSSAMEDLVPGIRSQLTGPRSISRAPPADWTWHHAAEPGVMQLVPRAQHTAAGPFQDLFHPGGAGGYSIWGQ